MVSMDPRYFAHYRSFRNLETTIATVAFGRFRSEEEAARKAKSSYDVPGYAKLLSVRRETATEAFLYRIWRIALRCFRVLMGLAIALAAYIWLFANGGLGSIGDVPMSALTLNIIFAALIKGAFIVGGGILCWYIAFGDGPDSKWS